MPPTTPPAPPPTPPVQPTMTPPPPHHQLILHDGRVLSATQARQLIEAGARCVRYEYCVSVVLATCRRQSGIYLIGPDPQPRWRAAWRGWPFACITLVAGWWGLPWGVIESVRCLWSTVSGGVDVTPAVYQHVAKQGD